MNRSSSIRAAGFILISVKMFDDEKITEDVWQHFINKPASLFFFL